MSWRSRAVVRWKEIEETTERMLEWLRMKVCGVVQWNCQAQCQRQAPRARGSALEERREDRVICGSMGLWLWRHATE